MSKTKDAISDLLDIDKEFISNDFITDHMEDIAKAAKGDEDAIDRLRDASLESIMVNVSFAGDTELEAKFRNALDGLKQIADNANLEVGASLDLSKLAAGEQEYLNILNNMLLNGEMTEADLNNALSAIGYNPVYSEETFDVPQKIPVTTTHHRIANFKLVSLGENGLQGPTWDDVTTVETSYQEVNGEQTVSALGSDKKPPTIKTHKLTGVTQKATGSYNNYSSSNKGGGSPGSGSGSDKKPKKQEHIDDEADRYHQVDTQINKTDKSLEKLQSQTDKYFGSKKIDNLNQQ